MASQAPPTALCWPVDATRLEAAVIEDLRELFERYPGDSEFVLEMHTATGLRRLKFGSGYRVAGRNAGLKAELDRLLGKATPPAPPEPVAAPEPAIVAA
jgi:DNA polymerase-3 subunit alpha